MAGSGSPDGSKLPAAAAAAADSTAGADEVEMVPMPESHIQWILAQEIRPVISLDNYSLTTDMYPQKFLDDKRELLFSIRESLLASNEEFAKYQAWVRETYEREGRIMVPAPIDPVQEELNRLSLKEEIKLIFAEADAEYERDCALLGLTAEGKTQVEAEGVKTGFVAEAAEAEGKTEVAEAEGKTEDGVGSGTP